MSYSIGEVSKTTNIPISTLRYYDREGMFPNMARSNGGIRVFSEKEVATIKVIDCLKNHEYDQIQMLVLRYSDGSRHRSGSKRATARRNTRRSPGIQTVSKEKNHLLFLQVVFRLY